MRFQDLLSQKKDAILERWLWLVMETYPEDTSRLLEREKDRFMNPVRFTVSREIDALFEELLHEMNHDRISASLDQVIRIRSVQDFSPSQAIQFVFLLKRAIEEVLGKGIRERQFLEEWLQLQSKVDEMALLAFDLYMECREKICEIKVREAKAGRERAFRLLERIGVVKGKIEKGEDLDL